jgi:fructokinase
VLWDILPSGAVPGGAPMNVAYHLHKAGKNPALITRIGNDESGSALKGIFSDHRVCTDYFQVDHEHETGKVYAHPNERNEVVYDIVMPVAWDFIEWHDAYEKLVTGAEYFVFGSLAARNKESKNTLFGLLEKAKNKVLDINLRAPYYNKPIVEELLSRANLLKLNQAELELISGWYPGHINTGDQLKFISEKFAIPAIVVSMGEQGALFHLEGKTFEHKGFQVRVTDTVGSGDAFLAGLLSKLIEGEKPQQALAFANALGAFIATKRGACPPYEIKEVLSVIEDNTKQTTP